VKLLADTEKPILAPDVYAAVDDFVGRGTLQQLLIYFSGHGFLLGRAEYWLLSQAPDNPNEAINLDGSVELARDCGIPNVAFISDACRSTSDSLRSQSVHGYQIFPTSRSVREPRAEVDRFFATLPGDPALEVPVAKSVSEYEGIYTACFLEAFEHPDTDIVVRLVDGPRVVPNRKLKPYLVREVRKRVEAKTLTLRQDPDAILESGEMAYIARVPDDVQVAAPSPSPAAPQVTATLLDVAGFQLARAGVLPQRSAVPDSSAIQLIDSKTGFTAAQDAIREAQSAHVQLLQSASVLRTGIVVSGIRLGCDSRSRSPLANN
jgi:hypothetical protein